MFPKKGFAEEQICLVLRQGLFFFVVVSFFAIQDENYAIYVFDTS